MDTMEFVSASFFISSIVILQGGAALGGTVGEETAAHALTHTYTPPNSLSLTHAHTHSHTHARAHAPKTQRAPE